MISNTDQTVEPVVMDMLPATLEDLERLKLLDRYDIKFLLEQETLPGLLAELNKNFRMLEIDNERIFKYENLYFDTDDNYFYKQHHNGKLNRVKVRIRKYSSCPNFFFEIKLKSNKDKIVKERLIDSTLDRELADIAKQEALRKYHINPAELKPKLTVFYDRITLVHKTKPVKITFDSNLYYKNCVKENALPRLVIAECKTEHFSGCPDFLNFMKNHSIHVMRVSKYCIGMVLLDPELKHNRFKQKMMFINKLLSENNGQSKLFRV